MFLSTISGMTEPRFATRRRTELFDALVRLLLAEGFAHLTLDDIAASLKCSKSTLYTLAGSKEQLVRAATIHFFRRATDDVEAQVARTEGARDRIIAYVSAVGRALGTASAQFMADLDGFAPAKNPDLWSARIFHLLARLAAPGATLATWSVAGSGGNAIVSGMVYLAGKPDHKMDNEAMVDHIVELVEARAAAIEAAKPSRP